MNKKFKTYVDSLTPMKKRIAEEAIKEFLAGEAEIIEKVDSPKAVYDLCRDLQLESDEHAVIVLANQRYGLIKKMEIAKGGLTETCFDVRVVMRECLINNATVLFLVHNHPSGDTKPSRDDDSLTKKMQDAARLLRIHLADHVIVANGNYYSYQENGRL